MKKFFSIFSSLLFSSLLYSLLSFSVWISPPLIAQEIVPYRLAHLNWDCYVDTLWAEWDSVGFRLRWIHWGRPSVDTLTGDTLWVCPPDSLIDPQRWVSRTEIVYPSDGIFQQAIVQPYNQSDSLIDILWWWKHRWYDSLQQRWIDTALMVVIYGQRGLDTLVSIDLGQLQLPVQDSPYVARQLRLDQELISPAVREGRGMPSRQVVIVEPPATSGGDPSGGGNRIVSNVEIRLYPQPVQWQVFLELRQLPAGEYSIVVRDLRGYVVKRQELVGRISPQQVVLVLEGLPAGVYVVQLLEHSVQLIWQQPIVVVP